MTVPSTLLNRHTVLNETGHILKLSLSDTAHEADRRDLAQELRTRYELQGFSLPRLLYLDNCCNERSSWQQAFETLARQAPVKAHSDHPLLELPTKSDGSENIHIHLHTQAAGIVCSGIVDLAERY